jgi:periplasmic divalent cation tolerance protein
MSDDRVTSSVTSLEAVELVYVTAPTIEVAEKIAVTVVEERIAACANILPQMTSVYRWQGSIQRDSEVVLICKTATSCVGELIARIVALHPYECPCVISFPVRDGNAAFLSWVNAQTQR